ncbi:MAG: SpoIVB peptidase S55 domain-containing protein [Candidatus Bipolaricaulia bacterium]
MDKSYLELLKRKPTVVLLIFLGLLFMVPTVSGATEESFLGLEEIQKDMKGVGKTVVKGTKMSKFSVDVVDVINKPGELEDFVIVRVSGNAIEKSGGVAQGMSGSPIYIDGKLIGALSRSALWSRETEEPIALVTPIKTMIKLLEKSSPNGGSKLEEERKKSVQNSLEKAFPDKSVSLGNSKNGSSADLVFTRSRTPIMVGGFSDTAFKALTEGIDSGKLKRIYDPLKTLGSSSVNNLKDGLSDQNLAFHNVQVNAGKSDQSMKLTPGGPFGVALTKGDLSIGALGTVTYREGDNVLGFGHRFLLSGNSNYLLTKAHVFDTVNSYRAPFKLGSVASPVGTVTQDRTQGVLGKAGVKADLFETEVKVSKMGTKKASKLQTDLVKAPELVGPLSYVTLLESINRSLNRKGPGTVKVSYEITGKNMPQPLKRTDIFFSYTQASYLPSLQVALFIDALAHNPFKKPGLTNLKADVSFQSSINSAQIMYFATDGKEYQPGDLLAYQVKLKNYRDDIVKKTGAFQLPKNLPEGNYILATYGGPRPTKIAPPQNLENFKDWLGYLNNLKSYEHLSVELLKPFNESVVPMASVGYMYESVTRVDHKFDNRVIYGNQAVSIKVTKAKEEAKKSESDSSENKQGTEG